MASAPGKDASLGPGSAAGHSRPVAKETVARGDVAGGLTARGGLEGPENPHPAGTEREPLLGRGGAAACMAAGVESDQELTEGHWASFGADGAA